MVRRGVIGSALRFDGTNGYLPTELTGKDLGIDGKKARTISFWVNAEGIGKSDSGFYGYGSLLNSDGTNQYWTIRRIDNTNFSRFQSEHWGWGRWISHGTSLLSSGWVHFAHIYDGNNIMVYRDASRVDNVARAQIGTEIKFHYKSGDGGMKPMPIFMAASMISEFTMTL